MAARNASTAGGTSGSEVEEYLLDDERISYELTYRPTGFVNWLKSLFGVGVTHWYLTDQRLIEYTGVTGGFDFQDVEIAKISSVEYGRKLNLPTVVVGGLLAIFGLITLTMGSVVGPLLLLVGAGLVAYAFYRRGQTLAVHASGGVTLALRISKGERVDEFIWYLNAERRKHRGH